MKLTLKRKTEIKDTVLGELYIDDKFFCYTLEDKIRDVKIKHHTCISPGEYKIALTMSQRFKTILPLLLNVPNFEGIRIHAGNTIEDTSGCILVGTAIKGNTLLHSKVALQELINKFKMAVKNKKPLLIKVENPEKVVKAKPKSKQPDVVLDSTKVETPKTEVVDSVSVAPKEVLIGGGIQLKHNNFKNFIQWILSIFKN